MFSDVFDSFDESALGSYIESPLGARGGGIGDLIVCGNFDSMAGVDDTAVVASWDGSQWFTIGGGFSTADTSAAITTFNDEVYMALLSGGVSTVQRFRNGSWEQVGDTFGSGVVNFSEFNGRLLALGVFDNVGSTLDMGGIASLSNDTDDWESVFDEGLVGTVRRGLPSGSGIYFGGDFDETQNGAVKMHGMAFWNGSSFSEPGGGLYLTSSPAGAPRGPRSMLFFEGDLIIHGPFRFADTEGDDIPISRFGRLDGNVFEELAGGTDNMSSGEMVIFNGKLVCTGSFQWGSPVGAASTIVAFWDGSAFSPVGTNAGIKLGVTDVLIFQGDLIGGGQWTAADDNGDTASGIAKFDGTNWIRLGEGLDDGFIQGMTVASL